MDKELVTKLIAETADPNCDSSFGVGYVLRCRKEQVYFGMTPTESRILNLKDNHKQRLYEYLKKYNLISELDALIRKERKEQELGIRN